MNPSDLLSLGWGALRAHKLRSRMTAAAIAIGVASVLLLTALGQGAREWVVGQFSALGSNILAVIPGRTETRGGPPLATSTTRDLTLADMQAITKRMPGVIRTVPIVIGEATVEHEGKGRAAPIIGSTREWLRMRDIAVGLGEELPDLEPDQGARVCIIGRTIRKELFGDINPLGERIKIGEYPFRVIGVVGQKGRSMMVNVDEIVLVPVANAMQMFNRTGLFRIVVQVSAYADMDQSQRRLNDILKERHDGEEDFTILTPGAVAESLGNIVGIITGALAGIAAVSLMVAGIGVMNVMVVSVVERTPEIGIMKAIGAGNGQVLAVFLAEAVALSLFGGAIGIAAGFLLTEVAYALYPSIPFHVPMWSVYLAVGISVGVGVAFGVIPAMRAARMDPLEALRRKV